MFLLAEIIFVYIFKGYITNHDNLAIIIVLLNSLLILIVLAKFKGNLFVILTIAFFLRLVFMFWDVYGREYLILPHSGGDTENYYISAKNIVTAPSLLFENIYGGLYTKLLGLLFILGPESRIIPQYINILLSMSSIIIIWKILKELNVKDTVIKFVLLIFALFPHSIIFSSILLRESVLSFIIILSIYYLLQWFKEKNVSKLILSILLILIGSAFHSGVIGLLVGVLYLYFFYSFKAKKIIISSTSFLKFIISTLFIFLLLSIGLDRIPVFNKFTQYADSIEDVYSIASGGAAGGSSYLQNLTINNPVELILYTPIKFIYFVLSPLPWDWRGLSDVFSFLFDSTFYIIVAALLLTKFKSIIKDHPLLLGLLIGVLTTMLIFSIGISNAGTGMRHRYKLFLVLLTMVGIVLDRNIKKVRRMNNDKKIFNNSTIT